MMDGPADKIIKYYLYSLDDTRPEEKLQLNKLTEKVPVIINKWWLENKKKSARRLALGNRMKINVEYECLKNYCQGKSLLLVISVKDMFGNVILLTHNELESTRINCRGNGGKFKINIPCLQLKPGKYLFCFQLYLNSIIKFERNYSGIEIEGTGYFPGEPINDKFPSTTLFRSKWIHEYL